MARNAGDRSVMISLDKTKKDLFKSLVETAPRQEVHNTVHARTPKLSTLNRTRHYENGHVVFPEKSNKAKANSSLDKFFNPEKRAETPDPMWVYNKKTQLRDKIRQHTAGGPTEIRQAFRDFDANANGVIDAKEFRGFCNRMNLMLTKKEGVQLFQSYDTDNDGRIDFYEFVDKILNESDFKRPNMAMLKGRERMARAKLMKQILENERELVNSREKLIDQELQKTNSNALAGLTEEEKKKLLYASPRHSHLVPIGPTSRNGSRGSNGVVKSGRRATATNDENALPPRPVSQVSHGVQVSARSAAFSQRSRRPGSVPLPETGRSHASNASGCLQPDQSGTQQSARPSARDSARARMESAQSYTSDDMRREKRRYVKQILSELLTMDQKVDENEELFKDVLKEISKDRLTQVLDKVLAGKAGKSSL